MKRKLIFRGILTAVIFLFNIPVLFAAPPPPGGPSIPIDGGASLLAAAGVAYGIKKYRDYRKDQPQDDDIA